MQAAKGTKAIVIGAGIGGLSAAIALRRVGIEATVFERMNALREVGSGLTLWTNAMRALDKLGIAEQVRARGGVVRTIENRSWQGDRWSSLPIEEMEKRYGQPGVGIHRGVLQTTLAGALGEGAIQLGAECQGFDQDSSGVAVRFGGGREERADLLVAADGINSVVRAQLFGKGTPRYSGYTCWRSAARFTHPLAQAGVYIQAYGPGMNFGLFPIGPDYWSWYATLTTPAGGGLTATAQERKREAVALFKDWYAPLIAVIEATDDNGVVRQDIADRIPIESWGEGRVTLLGDAAHATTPALGQGGCMAIEDAVVLARCLSLGGDIPTALRQYANQRKGRANGIVRQARRHGTFYHSANPAMRVARDIFFRTAPVPIALREVDKLMGYEA